jgi:hypothetical protein
VFRQYVFDVLLLITCAYSMWRGGPPERWVGFLLGIGDLVSVAVVTDRAVRFQHEELRLALVDGLLFVALYGIALRSTRWWPLYVAAFQLIFVGVHLMRIFAPDTLPLTYFNTTSLWSYPMILALFAGTWRHGQRVAFFGEDPPWKGTSSTD